MGNLQSDTNQKPLLTIADLYDDANYLVIPTDILQLQVDTLNVLQGNLSISTFPTEYQQKIMDYYRFSADFQNRRSPQKPAKRTTDTLDLI